MWWNENWFRRVCTSVQKSCLQTLVYPTTVTIPFTGYLPIVWLLTTNNSSKTTHFCDTMQTYKSSLIISGMVYNKQINWSLGWNIPWSMVKIFLGDQFYFSIYIIPNLKPEYGDVCRGSQKKKVCRLQNLQKKKLINRCHKTWFRTFISWIADQHPWQKLFVWKTCLPYHCAWYFIMMGWHHISIWFVSYRFGGKLANV